MNVDTNVETYGLVNAGNGEPQPLAMQELHLGGRVLPVGAVLVVRHTFRIKSKGKAEVIYSFGLPRDAALRRFKVIGDGFTVDSKLRPADEAVKLYEEGIEDGHLGTLARTYRDGVVNLSVGNIRPEETVTVLLEIVTGVEIRDDGFRFRFPFTLPPGYHPQAITSVADDDVGEIELPEEAFGDVILPRWQAMPDGLHAVRFALEIDAPQGTESVGSTSHPIRVERSGRCETRVVLATDQDVPNRDLVLDVKCAMESARTFAGDSADGERRFITVLPSGMFGEAKPRPRRLVLTLDRSGSMGGAPLDQARKAVEAVLGALTEEDRFSIVAFDHETAAFSSKLVPGSVDQRENASRFLAGIDAQGGTELAAGLEVAAKILGAEGGDILLLTDGEVFGSEDVVHRMSGGDVRVHVLGIGSASRDRFLEQLARTTNAVNRSMTPGERVDLAVLDLFAAIKTPLATGVTAEIAGAGDGEGIEPAPAKTVHQGVPLVVCGSTTGADERSLGVAWETEAGAASLTVPIATAVDGLFETLKLIQGARLVADLESALGAPGAGAVERKEHKRREARLRRVSETYQLASRVMALVAVVKRAGDTRGELPETSVVPVGLPAGMDMDAYFSEDALYAVAPPSIRSGLAQHLSSPPASPRHRGELGACYDLADGDEAPLMARHSEDAEAIDLLIELAARIDPDGGMPGRDDEERVLFSLIALMAFSHAHAEWGIERFGHHVKRLISFLESSAAAPAAAHEPTVRTVIREAEASRPFFASWDELVARGTPVLERRVEDDAWDMVARGVAHK